MLSASALIAPRRHRRRLLLPPGWVALAGLLWLGSVAVGWWEKQLGPQHTLSLTMPPISKSDTILPDFTKIIPPQKGDLILYSQLPTFCPWQDIEFTGNSADDSIARIKVRSALTQLEYNIKNYLYRKHIGVRINFRPNASYGMLVASLDAINNHDIKKFLTDSKPNKNRLTIYCLPPEPRRDDIPFQNFCGTSSYNPTLIKLKPATKESVLDNLSLLCLNAKWRLSMLIMVVIALLNIYKTVRSQYSLR